MSTRSAIARPVNTEGETIAFAGVYHHWDGYPEALGQTLFQLYNGFFGRDLDRMLKTLIDDHPAGWSTINGKDFALAPGFSEYGSASAKERGNQPECYCHGDRHEEAQKVTEENASDMGCEYVYLLKNTPDGAMMMILSSYSDTPDGAVKMIGMFGAGDPDATWKPVAVVGLDANEEPDWSHLGELATA